MIYVVYKVIYFMIKLCLYLELLIRYAFLEYFLQKNKVKNSS